MRTGASKLLSVKSDVTSCCDTSYGKLPTYNVRSSEPAAPGGPPPPPPPPPPPNPTPPPLGASRRSPGIPPSRRGGSEENGRTEIGRPACSDPSSESRADAASSDEANVTKPKPRTRPVARSRGKL